MKLRATLWYFVAVLIAVFAILLLYFRRKPVHMDGIWIINLDKDTERYDTIIRQCNNIRDLVHRWPATYGKTEPVKDALADGVNTILSTRKYEKDTGSEVCSRNTGAIGCWLSHKRLMRHLSELPAEDNAGHLILEDDIQITPGFMDAWEARKHTIPADWDIIHFSINRPKGIPAGEGIQRILFTADTGNWGTQAYMVRHGSLKSRILPKLRFMDSEIDVQLNNYSESLNMYFFSPSILALNLEMAKNSTINNQ